MQISGLRMGKTVFTRQCIGEAVVSLLKERELKLVKVLDVVRKAGVSRMTFYKYYSSPQSALEDYLHLTVAEYLEASSSVQKKEFSSYEHLLFALQFFDRYRDFFLTMKRRGLYSVLIDSVNDFVGKHMPAGDEEFSVYRRYSYAGSLLNCFIMWEANGRQERVEDVAQTLYALYSKSTI